MPWSRLLPAILALLLLGAHFLHDGLVYLVPLCVGLAALLFVRLRWVPVVVSLVLLLAGVEWLRTLYLLASARISAGQPHLRLVLILAGVAILTWLAAWLLRSAAARRWYRGD